jgi:hypothetical protein
VHGQAPQGVPLVALRTKTENWTLVVVGAWNTRIFTPEWVGGKLFQSGELTTEVNFTPGQSILRFTHSGVSVIPQDDRLIVGVQELSAETLQRAEGVLLRLLDLLPHTPVTAFGVNLGFREARPKPELTEIFRASDHGQLSAKYEVGRIELTRTLGMDGGVLNLKHAFDDGAVEIHFNFHHQAAAASEAAERFRGLAERYRAVAAGILEEVYGLRVREDTDDE